MGWLLHCNTGSTGKHKPSVPCSILLSNNYVIVKGTLWAAPIQGTAKNQSTSSNQAFLSRLSFVPSERKVGKMHLLCDKMLLYPSSINFCYSEINDITAALVCLAKVSQHSTSPNVMNKPVLIVRVILQRWSLKTLILSSLTL